MTTSEIRWKVDIMKDKPRIVIIDDEVDMIANLKDIMCEYYIVEAAYDGKSGLTLCSENTFDVAIIDIKLPDITGEEIAKRITELSPKTDCILISAYASLESALEAVKLEGVVAYEVKPLDMDHILSLINEIIKRRRAEDALRESEIQYSALFQNNPIQTVVVDTEGRVIAYNKAKRQSGDRLPMPREVMYKDYASGHKIDMHMELMNSIKSGKLCEYHELEYGDKVLSVKISPFEKGAIITSQDITGRKKNEEKIKNLNELLFAIRSVNRLITQEKDIEKLLKGICTAIISTHGYSQAWIIITDEFGNIISFFHDGMANKHQVFEERLMEDTPLLCFDKAMKDSSVVIINDPASKCIDCPLSQKYDNSKRVLFRLEYNNRIFGVLGVEVQSFLLFEDAEQSLLKEVADDIAFALYSLQLEDEHKKLQEQLYQSAKLSAVGQLAAGVAHEFNNILTIILGHAQISIAEDSIDEIKQSLHEIEKMTKRGSDLVKDLSTYAKPTEPRFKTQDITGVIDEVIQLQRKKLRLDNIEIERNYAKHSKTSFDRGQMEQVFLNLLINASHAIKAKKKGTISISVRDSEGFLVIGFTDTGIGMDEDTTMKIFDPFFTTKGGWAEDREGLSGTGLGLSVTHAIIEQHNGSIVVESKKGKGTTFTITLPIVESNESIDNLPQIEKNSNDVNRAKNLRVLIVDDEEDVIDLMKLLLKRAGLNNVAVENNGRKAIGVFKSYNPDIVFLDILMPDMSGTQVFHQIKSMNQQVPVVFMSGRLGFEKDKLIDEGAYAFIQKPFDFNEIFKILNNVANVSSK